MGGLCCLYPGPNKDFPGWNDPTYRFSGNHVEDYAFILTMSGFFSPLLKRFFSWLIWNSVDVSQGGLLSDAYFICLVACAFYALCARKPAFYLPFIIGNALYILLILFVSLLKVIIGDSANELKTKDLTTTNGGSTKEIHIQEGNLTIIMGNGTFFSNTTVTINGTLVVKNNHDDGIPAMPFHVVGQVVVYGLFAAILILYSSLYWRAWKYMEAEVAWIKSQKRNRPFANVALNTSNQ